MTPLYRWSCVETSRGCIGSSGPIPNPSFKDSCIFKTIKKKLKNTQNRPSCCTGVVHIVFEQVSFDLKFFLAAEHSHSEAALHWQLHDFGNHLWFGCCSVFCLHQDQWSHLCVLLGLTSLLESHSKLQLQDQGSMCREKEISCWNLVRQSGNNDGYKNKQTNMFSDEIQMQVRVQM